MVGVAVLTGANAAYASTAENDAGTATTLVTSQTASASASTTVAIVATNIAPPPAPVVTPPPAPAPAPAAPTPAPAPAGPEGGPGGAPGAPGGPAQDQSSLGLDGLDKLAFNTRSLSGVAAGGTAPRLGAWLQTGYTWVDNDEANGQFDGNVVNVVAGLDYKPRFLRDKGVVGVALGYEDLDVTTAFNKGTFEGSGFMVAPYFGYSINRYLSMDAVVGYTNLDYDNAVQNNTTTNSFDADRVFAATNLTGNFFFARNRLRATPKVGVLGLVEFQERHTNNANAVIKASRTRLGKATFGGEVGYRMRPWLEPFVNVRGEWDFIQNAPVWLTATRRAQDDDFSATYGAGVNLNWRRFSGQIQYQTNQHKNELTTHSVMGRLRISF